MGNSLIDMYIKCGSIMEARMVFDELPVRDTISWNVIAAGYADYGLKKQVFYCLEQMQVEGISPDSGSFVCFLKACFGTESLIRGALHNDIAKEGFEKNPFVSTVNVEQ